MLYDIITFGSGTKDIYLVSDDFKIFYSGQAVEELIAPLLLRIKVLKQLGAEQWVEIQLVKK